MNQLEQPYAVPHGGQFWNGAAIDPIHIVNQFRKILSMYPVHQSKKTKDVKGGYGTNYKRTQAKKILLDRGHSEEDIKKWIASLPKTGAISVKDTKTKDGKEITSRDQLEKKFKKWQALERAKEAIKAEEEEKKRLIEENKKKESETKDEDEKKEIKNETKALEEEVKALNKDKKTIEKTQKQDLRELLQEGSAEFKNKMDRLNDFLKTDFNLTATTRLPSGLETEFLQADPENEAAIIDKYRSKLEATQVQSQLSQQTADLKKQLEEESVQEKVAEKELERVRRKQTSKGVKRPKTVKVEEPPKAVKITKKRAPKSTKLVKQLGTGGIRLII